MSKAIVYAVMGLISLALLLGLGITIRLIVRMFVGKREKALEQDKDKDRYCHCGKPDSCPQYGPYRLH